MSTEQEKDALAQKRNRGGDGLEALSGQGVLVGSSDKKKRKPNSQVPPFVPLSEYAPPLNPSADHLVASNPFDDGFSIPSYKTSSTNPYFGPTHYPGFCGYNPHRMPPHIQNRMPTPYGGGYPVRNQLHPFGHSQMTMTFNRPTGFNYGHPDSPGYGNPAMFTNNGNMPMPKGQAFRTGLVEHFNQMPLNSSNQSAPAGTDPPFVPIGNNSGNPVKPCADTSPGFTAQQQQKQLSQQSNFVQSTPSMPKQELGDPMIQARASPHKQGQSSDENLGQANASNLKAKNKVTATSPNKRHPSSSDKINGIIHPSHNELKKSPSSGVLLDPSSMEEKWNRTSGGNLGPAGANKHRAHPSRTSLSTSEPVYPCGICLNEVNDDQEAILCDASCQKWFHRDCTGMTETAYNLLAAEASAVWGCDSCMEEKGAPLVRAKETSGFGIVNSEG